MSEKYQPSEKDMQAAREMMTDGEKALSRDREDFYLYTDQRLNNIFQNNPTPDEKLNMFNPVLDSLLEQETLDQETVDKVKSQLAEACQLEDKGLFVANARDAMKPVMDVHSDNAPEFWKAMRNSFDAGKDWNRASEMLYYGVDDDTAHIHLAPRGELGPRTAWKSVVEGLKNLALDIDKNGDVKQVTATAWIVAEAPELLERLGFTVMGEIDEETKKKRFANETRPVHWARVSIEDFKREHLNK